MADDSNLHRYTVIPAQTLTLPLSLTAPNPRAAEIASTFSAGIATFEQRLLKLEEGVQEELQGLGWVRGR